MAMDPAIVTALTVAVPAVVASTLAPAVIAWMNGRNATRQRHEEAKLRSEERKEEWYRQDEIARRLVESNKVVATEVIKNRRFTGEKLEEIHTLVNSSYTAALQAALEAVQAKLVVLMDSVAFKKEQGVEASPEMMADIEATKKKLEEMTAAIYERVKQDVDAKEEKAKMILAGAQQRGSHGEGPLPVTDERTAVASERVASAAERSADATSRVADAAEEMKKK